MPTNKKKSYDDDEMRDASERDLDMDEEVEPGMKKNASSQHASGNPPAGTTKNEGEPGRRSSTPKKRK